MIKIGKRRHHQKASEVYQSVEFRYDDTILNWDIPIEYRRTGTDFIDKTESEVSEYLNDVYEKCAPKNWVNWKSEQVIFWKSKPRAGKTKEFFDVLMSNFKWHSVESDLPKNPNWARRIQDIKEFGYTLATNTSMYDSRIKQNCTHILLIPLPRGGITGYEIWTKETRNRILNILNNFDEYEAKLTKKEGLLPDHKFPEIRWDQSTKRSDINNLTDQQILNDFQLMTNQRNQQKREVCRSCYQTGKRGVIYGISYYYEGDENWPENIPKNGKEAENGCKGCGWYDIKKWRKSINQIIN